MCNGNERGGQHKQGGSSRHPVWGSLTQSLYCLSLNYNRIYEQCVSALSGPFEPEQPKQLQPLNYLLQPFVFPKNMHCHSATIQGKGVGGQGHSLCRGCAGWRHMFAVLATAGTSWAETLARMLCAAAAVAAAAASVATAAAVCQSLLSCCRRLAAFNLIGFGRTKKL